MTFSSFLSEHWGLLVLLTGMLIVLYLDIHLERRMVIRIAVTYGMIFLYSVSDYVETYLS